MSTAGGPPVTVTLAFSPSRDDYLGAARDYYTHRWTFRIAFVGFVMMFVIGLLALVALNWRPLNAALLMLFLPLYFFFLRFIVPGRVTRQLKRNPRLLAKMTWVLRDDNITLTAGQERRTIGWQTYHRAVETKGYFLLFLAANQDVFDFLPKSAVRTPDDLAALRGLLARRFRSVEEAR